MKRISKLHAASRAVLVLLLALLIGLRVWPRHAMGLRVRIASDTCGGFPSCIAPLTVTGDGGLLLGGEAVGMDGLVSDLSGSYGSRSKSVLYFAAADNVPFQRIAEVIDALQNATPSHVPPLPEALRNSAADNLNIELVLVTPGAVNVPCHDGSYNWWKQGPRCAK